MFNIKTECDILNDTKFNRPCPFYKKNLGDKIDVDIYMDGCYFRKVKGFNGRYFVSEYGEVITKGGITKAARINANGLMYVSLTLPNGNHTTRGVAQLVADAWLGGTGKIEFKDGDTTNCCVWNLRRVKDNEKSE